MNLFTIFFFLLFRVIRLVYNWIFIVVFLENLTIKRRGISDEKKPPKQLSRIWMRHIIFIIYIAASKYLNVYSNTTCFFCLLFTFHCLVFDIFILFFRVFRLVASVHTCSQMTRRKILSIKNGKTQ